MCSCHIQLASAPPTTQTGMEKQTKKRYKEIIAMGKRTQKMAKEYMNKQTEMEKKVDKHFTFIIRTKASLKVFVRSEITKAVEVRTEEIRRAAQNYINKCNEEVLKLDDHDERKVAGRHYRFMLGKHAAFYEFSKFLTTLTKEEK